jgi:hypothetical protein
MYTYVICRMHMEALRLTNNGDRLSNNGLYKKHRLEFSDWYRNYVSVMPHLGDVILMVALLCNYTHYNEV